VLVVAGAAWAFWSSPLLAVRTVQVDGTSSLSADQVREAAGVPDGTPLIRVDVDAAEARVARLPQVASVAVTRGWPDRVVITVRERVAVAVVERDGRRTLVDATGMLFDTISGQAPEGVVLLDVPAPGPDDPATEAALAAVSELPDDIRARVAGATATSDGEITLTLVDRTTVLWGDAQESAAKAEVLGGLLQQVESGALERARTIDVGSADAVVLR